MVILSLCKHPLTQGLRYCKQHNNARKIKSKIYFNITLHYAYNVLLKITIFLNRMCNFDIAIIKIVFVYQYVTEQKKRIIRPWGISLAQPRTPLKVYDSIRLLYFGSGYFSQYSYVKFELVAERQIIIKQKVGLILMFLEKQFI